MADPAVIGAAVGAVGAGTSSVAIAWIANRQAQDRLKAQLAHERTVASTTDLRDVADDSLKAASDCRAAVRRAAVNRIDVPDLDDPLHAERRIELEEAMNEFEIQASRLRARFNLNSPMDRAGSEYLNSVMAATDKVASPEFSVKDVELMMADVNAKIWCLETAIYAMHLALRESERLGLET